MIKFQSVASKDTTGLSFPYFPGFNQEFCHNIFVKAKPWFKEVPSVRIMLTRT